MSSQPILDPPRPGQLEFTTAELLSDTAYDEPLVVDGVRCHGGFVDAEYVSPRCLHRVPAIEAWQAQLRDEGHALLSLPKKYVPPHYPNYAQAKLLLQEGLVDPVTRSLTIISIVEGFGARIRDLPLPDIHKEIVEDIDGTCLAHLGSGLYEAHARDEAGHRDQGGHKQMWEAARDIGLDKPEIPGDVLMRMMMGRPPASPGEPPFPQLSRKLVGAISMMTNVMVVEIFAEDVFEWAKNLLGDPEIATNPESAARLVAHIQSDEKPHVEYLRTALSEIRCRTLRSADGKTEIRGAEVIDALFAERLRGVAAAEPAREREGLQKEIHEAIEDRAQATRVARKFEDLDSGWVFPELDDDDLYIRLETPEAALPA